MLLCRLTSRQGVRYEKPSTGKWHSARVSVLVRAAPSVPVAWLLQLFRANSASSFSQVPALGGAFCKCTCLLRAR